MDIQKGFAYKGKDLTDKLKDPGEAKTASWKFIEKAMKTTEYKNFKQLHDEMAKAIKGIYQNIPTEKLNQDEKFAIKHLYMIAILYTTSMMALYGFMKPVGFDTENFIKEGNKALNTLDKLVKKADKDGSS